MTRRGWVLFAAMCVIWGVPYLFIKIAVRDFSPVTVVFLRTGIGALVLVPVAVARRELRPVLRVWPWLLVYTVCELLVPWLMLTLAEQRLPSSFVGLLVAAVPLVTAIVLLITRSADRLDLRRALGLVIGFIGVAALLGLEDLHGDAISLLEMGAVIIGYAIGPIIIARKLSSVPAMGVIASSLVITAVVDAPFAFLGWPAQTPSVAGIASVLALGLVCTALAFVLFFALIAEVGPARTTTFTYLNPVVALALGILILGEAFTIADVIGFVLIVGGLLLATRGRRPAPETGPSAVHPEPAKTAAPRH